jgi:hypothetical protein
MIKYIKKNLTHYIFFALITLIVLGIALKGWMVTWHALKIPSLLPPHFDLRFYQYPAYAINIGKNPLFAAHEFWLTPLFLQYGINDYFLPAFKFAYFLNLHKEIYFISFAILVIFFYIICVSSLLKIKKNSFWILILFFSNSSMLGIERTNNDLIIFCLIYYSAMFPNFIGISLAMLATYIEFWPIFSGIGFIKKKIKILFLICSVIFILIFNQAIFDLRMQPILAEWFSFGAKSLSVTIKRTFNLDVSYFAIVGLLIIITILTLIISGFKLEHKKKPDDFVERLFLIGATLYISLFIIASNFDYKLIFLLFCVPYLSLLKNIFAKWFILLTIIVASNYSWMYNDSLTSFGHYINIISKILIFIILLNILIRYFINFIINSGIKKIFF